MERGQSFLCAINGKLGAFYFETSRKNSVSRCISGARTVVESAGIPEAS
jgi:hypothetical protein